MQMASQKPDEKSPPAEERAPRGSYLSSIIALVVGIGLAVAVSSVFQILGWGGELASQTAGAASGAAPLIIDGVRHRTRRWSGTRQELLALTRGVFYRPRLLVASSFGFAVLLADTFFGFVTVKLTRALIRITHGDPARFTQGYALIGAILTIPAVLLATALLATAAGHRLGEHRRRWALFGIGIYTLVRLAMLLTAGTPELPGIVITPADLIAGVVLTLPLIIGATLLGTWRARRTQAVFNARAFFRRLPAEDQQATLALLGETVAARR